MSRIFPGLILLASASAVAPEYFAIGFTHILPYGLDHILFLLALFFLTQKPSDLLIQLTLFTLAHSFSMGLSLYGIVDAPGLIVEVAIALSITFVAAENLFRQRLSPWRPWIVFASGLVHGLGFAHSFGERTLDKGEFLPALFGYNMGIEAGQIVVIGIAYALVAVWWKRENYRKMIARPASLLIAASGLCWAAERLIY